MEGLSQEHSRFLNVLVNKTLEEGRVIYAGFRREYQHNPLALQQIDVYDVESPYTIHFKTFLDAAERGDDALQKCEEQWLAEHYPLVHKED